MTSSLPELSFQDGPVTGRPGDFSGTIVSQLLSNPESNSGNRIQNFLEEKHIFLTGSTGFLAKVRDLCKQVLSNKAHHQVGLELLINF
jgi:FlaA1/EpsC-like NDP-sugar epimerase